MEFLSTRTKGDWIELDKVAATGAAAAPGVDEYSAKKELLTRSLVETLQAQRFNVLCGLGTSLCIKDGAGTTLAPTMLDLWNATQAEAGSDFDKVLKKVRYPEIKTDLDKDIELLLSRCQLSQALEPDVMVEKFIETAESVIVNKCTFLADDVELPTHESFLRRIARRSTRSTRSQLFTTNYDICFERAASRLHFIAVDGFSHTIPQEFDSDHFSYDFVRREEGREAPDFIPNVFHLCKLHGSVDWERHVSDIRKASKPKRPVLIYPRHTKFESSYESPFLELIGRFQFALRQPNSALLVIGFGFNDKHLSEPILSAVRSNVGLRITVVDPELKTADKPAFVQLRNLVNGGDPRIVLVAAPFEEFADYLPDLVAITEDERHSDRIKGVHR